MKQRVFTSLFAVLLVAGQILPGYSVCVCNVDAAPMSCCEGSQEPPSCCGSSEMHAASNATPVSGPRLVQHGCDRDLTLSGLTAVLTNAVDVPTAAPIPVLPVAFEPAAPTLPVVEFAQADTPSPPGPPVFLLHAALLL